MKFRSIVLATLMILSVVAGSVALAGSAAASPAGFVTVDDSQVTSDLPENTPMGQSAQEIADAGVMTSAHADSLEVIVTSPGRAKNKIDGGEIHGSGPISIVLTDDENSEGRTVALPAAEVRDALGFAPQMARGTHESGLPWNEEIEYQDGWMLVDVPHFSTNTVSFAGSVQIGDTFTGSSSTQYDINDLDSASDVTVNLTGKLSAENETISTTSVGPTSTQSISIAGSSVGGPSANGKPELTVSVGPGSYNPVTDEGDGTAESDWNFVGDASDDATYKSELKVEPPSSRTVNEITVNVGSVFGSDYGPSVDIYIKQESAPDGVYTEGTLVKSGWDPSWSTGDQTITFDSSFEMQANTPYTIAFVTDSSDNDASSDTLQITTDGSASSVWFRESNNGDYQEYPNVTLEGSDDVSDLSVSDGAGGSVTVGNVSTSTSQTVEFADLSTSSTELSWSGSGGPFDYTLEIEERTQTEDPGVGYNVGTANETWANHTGTLADGETVTKTIDKSALQEGTNTIDVSMPTLSADAPAMQVQANISHDAQDDQSVEYQAEKFSERYNVSKTFASDRKDPTLTIPFADTAVSIRDAEYRLNGGDWTDADGWVLSNTTGTIHLPDMQAEDTVDVRANASKVAVSDGAIKVLEATPTADKLDTKIEITEHRPDFAIDVSGIDDDRLVFATDESWSEPDGHAYVDASGNQELRLPEAGVDSTARIQDLPMWVETDNDVEIAVTDRTIPRFQVRPGDTEDDLITIEYRDTVSGQAYALQKPDADDATDTDTAESPVYFDTTDSLATYEIVETTLGGATQPTGPVETEQSDTFPIMLLIGVVGALGGLLLISSGLGGSGRTGRQRDRTLSVRGYSVSLPSLPSIGGRSSDRTTQTIVLGGVVIVGIVALELASTEPLLEIAFSALAMGADTFGELLTIFVGIGALLGLWYLDKMTSDSIPTWLMGVAAVVTTVYIVETIQPGVLLGPASSGFETIAPLFWLVLLGGGSYFVYGYIQSRNAPDTEVTFELRGGNR